MDGRSADIVENNKEKLKSLFPEVLSEGKIDWERKVSQLIILERIFGNSDQLKVNTLLQLRQAGIDVKVV